METNSALTAILGETKQERIGTITLAVATVIVGASIVTDGTVSKALNGIAGITWFASSAMFILEGKRRGATGLQWVGIAALTAAVAFVVKPSDIVLATIGFVPAGIAAAMIVGKQPVFWAKMIPALYLPLHIGTAVLKAVVRNAMGNEASIRTDPPPTAAIVPAVMLGAAIVGGFIAKAVMGRRRQ
ncbi:MAG: hypothetical protein K5924_12725 [Chloroflexi bacterium]|nr:hypothetical protein [Chloroflexota bacterium]